MGYRVDVDRPTAALLRHLHPVQRQKIRASLDVIAKTPEIGKPLQRALAGLFSYRVGRFRIVYAVNHARQKIYVVAIGPRESIYDSMGRLKS